MMNCFDVLGVSRSSSLSRQERDEEIRRAYLKLIRQFPPDAAGDRFKQISAAYEKIKTERDRIHFELFEGEPSGASPLEALFQHLKKHPATRIPPKLEVFQEFLQTCAKMKN